jgi:hypothetical protein
MPTGQGEVGPVLLSPYEDGHYSNRKVKQGSLPKLVTSWGLCEDISSGLIVLLYAKS